MTSVLFAATVAVSLLAADATVPSTQSAAHRAALTPIPIPSVVVDDAFWSPKIAVWRKATIGDVLDKFEKDGVLTNYDHVRDATGAGTHAGPPFADGLLCEVIRGCSDFLAVQRDTAIERRIDGYIDRMAAAQAKDPDGYINTWTSMKEPSHRWGTNGGNDIIQHDVYNAGCVCEAGIHYYRATGKTKLLEVAVRLANGMAGFMGKPPKVNVIPGHSISEEAFVKLYLLFREQPELKNRMPVKVHEGEYLKLAESWIENRGNHVGRKPFDGFVANYAQDHQPVFEQQTLEGHAVRAALMGTGVAAIAPANGRGEYYASAERLWNNMTSRRMYLTGGLGAVYETESFAPDYQLPNKGYLETCAAIAGGFFDRNMNLAFGEARYVDELERALYNGALCGAAQSGVMYSYINPLEFEIGHTRWAWHGCPCCPPMFLKIMGAMPGYIYAQDARGLYVNLFVGGRMETTVHGVKVVVGQTTKYPWEGEVQIAVDPSQTAAFDLFVRIPGWCQNAASPDALYRVPGRPANGAVVLSVNGDKIAAPVMERGYVKISRRWQAGDRVDLSMAMPVQRVKAHKAVKDCEGLVALMRGPLVYAIETATKDPAARSLFLPPEASVEPVYRNDLLGGAYVLRSGFRVRSASSPEARSMTLDAIPYFAYGNRGPSALRVWIPESAEKAVPETLAGRAVPTASFCCQTDSLGALNDSVAPVNSDQIQQKRFSWWDRKGTSEWVQYDFAEPSRVSAVEVYWWDDATRQKGGCLVPQSWRLLYRDRDQWKPVSNPSPYGVKMDRFNRTTFAPVTTTALRIEAQLQPGYSGGIVEWKVD
jgi:DUF1680 family protein